MSLEDTIALAANEVGQARDEILGLTDVAQTQITRVSNTYNRILSNFSARFWINDVSGDDNAEGDADAPLKTVHEALSRTPRGGRLRVYLATDLVIRDHIYLNSRELNFYSDTASVRRQITFERQADTNFTPYRRSLANFVFTGASGVHFQNIRFVVPILDGDWASYTDVGGSNIFVGYGDVSYPVGVSFQACEIEFPATPFAAMFNSTPALLRIGESTFTGTSRHGWVHRSFTDTAGTPANDAAHLIMTNLPTI